MSASHLLYKGLQHVLRVVESVLDHSLDELVPSAGIADGIDKPLSCGAFMALSDVRNQLRTQDNDGSFCCFLGEHRSLHAVEQGWSKGLLSIHLDETGLRSDALVSLILANVLLLNNALVGS